MNNNINSKCGHVAIIGRPNVGKSTLLNGLIGEKISITTPKPQTTRHQILGIKTLSDRAQIIYIDTPGLHQAERRAMNRYMNRLANAVIIDADVVVFVIDSLNWKADDQLILDKLADSKAPVILAINKVDTLRNKSRLLPWIAELQKKFHFTDIIPLSAKTKENVLQLEEAILALLPIGPYLFPKEQQTDKNQVFQAAEIIREKLILAVEEELPYSTTIVIESLVAQEKIIEIQAVILVERDSQKAIVIGKKGERLKKMGTAARLDLEKKFGMKVFLRLWVKVKNNWTDDERVLQSLGYL